ncbi:MAG TPA: hypothetical protein VMW25_04370 [Clostridia bacterium]|nr:hypothetical protein [Clostridia bacterium]
MNGPKGPKPLLNVYLLEYYYNFEGGYRAILSALQLNGVPLIPPRYIPPVEKYDPWARILFNCKSSRLEQYQELLDIKARLELLHQEGRGGHDQ